MKRLLTFSSGLLLGATLQRGCLDAYLRSVDEQRKVGRLIAAIRGLERADATAQLLGEAAREWARHRSIANASGRRTSHLVAGG